MSKIIKLNLFILCLSVILSFNANSFAASQNKGNLRVMTGPDGKRGFDKTACLFKNQISSIEMYLYNTGQPIDMRDVELQVSLPDGYDIISYSFCIYDNRRRKWTKCYDMRKMMSDQGVKWSIPCIPGIVDRTLKAKPGLGNMRSSYHIYLYFYPRGDFNQTSFEISWEFLKRKENMASGTIQTKLIPTRLDRRNPKHFQLWMKEPWQSPGMDCREFDDLLQRAKPCGVTAFDSEGSFSLRKKLEAQGFSIINHKALRNLFIYGWGGHPPGQLEEKYYPVGLNGKRQKSFKEGFEAYHTLPWCPTVFATPGSIIFEMQTKRLKNAYKEGFRYFYSDTEPALYSQCFCPLCRDAFSKHAGINKKEIIALPPLDLIYKFPLKWYKFRSWQTGNLFKTFKKAVELECPDIKLGMDSNLNGPYTYSKGLGYGFKLFAEDARFTDDGVDFHRIDSIVGGVVDVDLVDCFFLNKIKKPKIAMAGMLMGVNVRYPYIVAKREMARQKGMSLGFDKRGEWLKLSVANMAALGVDGVCVSHYLDAECIDDLDKSMEFVAEFEHIFRKGNRLNEKSVRIHDITELDSPYHKIGPKGYCDSKILYPWAKKCGFIRYTMHEMNDSYLVSMFNWDIYQNKNIIVKIPEIQTGKYYIHIFKNGTKYLLTKNGKQLWNSDEIKNGISCAIPMAGLMGILVTKNKESTYSKSKPEKAHTISGTLPLDLYEKYWKKVNDAPTKSDLNFFYKYVYNNALRRISKRYTIPQKYFKSE